MKILKIINNNAVYSVDENGNGIIAMGRSVGWNTRVGDTIKEELIERIFHETARSFDRIEQIIRKISPVSYEIAEEICKDVRNVLEKQVEETAVLSLADHIDYAIGDRSFNNPNLILHEIKIIYPKEYLLGKQGVKKIKEKTGIELSDDEAGYIAMHIVNSYINNQNEDAGLIANLTHDVTGIISEVYEESIDEESFEYLRFLSHIKYLARRIEGNESNKLENAEELYDVLIRKNSRLKEATERITRLIGDRYVYDLSVADQVYLMMHILRIVE